MSPMKTPPKAGMLNEATLSLHQAASRLSLPLRELKALLGAGEIPFVEISGKLRVPTLSLEAYKNSQPESEKPHSATDERSLNTNKRAATRKAGKPPQHKRHPQ